MGWLAKRARIQVQTAEEASAGGRSDGSTFALANLVRYTMFAYCMWKGMKGQRATVLDVVVCVLRTIVGQTRLDLLKSRSHLLQRSGAATELLLPHSTHVL